MPRITPEVVRQLARAADIRPRDEDLPELASGLEVLLAAIERCEALGLAAYEPVTVFDLDTGRGNVSS